MTEQQKRDIAELDRAADETGGCFTMPFDKGSPQYDYLAMRKFCRDNNISLSDLTDEQLAKFILKIY